MSDRITCRSYSGPADLRAMQNLAQSIWSKTSRFHIGDLAWGRYQHAEREWQTSLWEMNESLVAWSWMQSEAELDLMVHPRLPFLVDQVLEWFERAAKGSELTSTVLDTELHLVDALKRQGFKAQLGGPFDLYTERKLGVLPELTLPKGYFAHPVRGEADRAQRVEVHRAAWSAALLPNPQPSRFTIDSYSKVVGAWPYQRELDWVIEAPDGRYASCCIAWIDEKNEVGELEPVGTHPEFRGLGLASAVCLSAMGALRQAGAKRAIVYPRGDDAYPVPRRIYAKLGFMPYGRTRRFVRAATARI